MKKFKKVFSYLMWFFIPFAIVFILTGYFKGKEINLDEVKRLFKSVFDKNLDFIILGSVIMFLYSTNFIQDFVHKKIKDKFLKIPNSFPIIIIVLIFISFGLTDWYEYFVNFISIKLVYLIFLLAFFFVLIFFLLINLFYSVFIGGIKSFFNINIFIFILISIFFSFFITLFFMLIKTAGNKEDLGHLIVSLIIIFLFSLIGEAFKKEEIED